MRKWIDAVIIIAFISLSWYGAEMLIYNYSQISVVKALVIALIGLSMASGIDKQREMRAQVAEIIRQAIEEIKKEEEQHGNEEEDHAGC